MTIIVIASCFQAVEIHEWMGEIQVKSSPTFSEISNFVSDKEEEVEVGWLDGWR